MDTDLPDFAGEQSSAPDAPQVQEPAPTPAPAPQEAPASPPEPKAPPEPAPAAPAPLDPAAPPPVPLATALEWRDRMTAAEKRAKELETWRANQEAAARRQPPPNREEDPDAYEQHRDQRFQSMIYEQKLAFSERMAVKDHGKDAVAAAKAWYDDYANQDPFFDRKVASSADPYEVVMEEWKRQQLLTRIAPEDIDQFTAWKAAQAANPGPQPPQAAAALQPPARPAAPRPSIAAAPSAGASADPQGMDGEQVFSAMFGT